MLSSVPCLSRGVHVPRRGRAAARVRAVAAASPPGFFVDEAELLKASKFPIQPDALIEKAKVVLLKNFGCSEPSLLAEDFKFVAPVVGRVTFLVLIIFIAFLLTDLHLSPATPPRPLAKDTFVQAFNSFDLLEAFPDMKCAPPPRAAPRRGCPITSTLVPSPKQRFQYHHFRVDPFEPARVWYTARAVGTHTGSFAGAIAATGKLVESPPQACSLQFNDRGECTQLTVGYVMDRQLGNTGASPRRRAETRRAMVCRALVPPPGPRKAGRPRAGGLGAVFGILYAIGRPLPFPEVRSLSFGAGPFPRRCSAGPPRRSASASPARWQANPWAMSWQYKVFNFLGGLAAKLRPKE